MQINNVAKFFVGLASIAMMSACNNNPYPQDPLRSNNEKQVIFPAMTINYSPVMEFREGEEKEYKITATVEKGSGILRVENLPQGASYDANTGTLRWKPSYTDGNDSEHPEKFYKNHSVTLYLESDNSNTTAIIQKTAILQVFNAPRSALIWTSEVASLKEGIQFTHEIILASEDYPNEQIQLIALGLPQSAKIESGNQPNQYFIRFTPTFDIVKPQMNNGSIETTKDIPFKLQAITSHGIISEKNILWTVQDSHLAPLVSGPTNLSITNDVYFTITANDINKESKPVIRLSNRPNFGQLIIEPLTTTDINTSVVSVRWFDIPPSAIGKTVTLEFSICSEAGAISPQTCSTHNIQISFTGSAHLPPVFDRAQWPLGAVKKVNVGEILEVSLPIKFYETQEMVTNVNILPSNNIASIQWIEGKLFVKGNSAGLMQFDLSATSLFGLTQKESMIVEVIQ